MAARYEKIDDPHSGQKFRSFRNSSVVFGSPLGPVAWAVPARRQNANAVMHRHHGIAVIDLGIVERGLVHAALESPILGRLHHQHVRV
jgi:hypothetical protein